MKGGKYTKTLAKIQVRGIFRIRDIRRNALPKLIEICMETPHMLVHTGRKPAEISVIVLLQKREFILRETHKH